MRVVTVLIISVALFIPAYSQVISHISGRSVEERLGYLPRKEVVRLAALNHKALISEWLFLKVLVYFGSKVGTEDPLMKTNIEYSKMYRFLDTATYLDPYNIDSYYFAQAAFTWEIGRVKEVNALLEKGLTYRTWDYYLPFFLGFNHFYFLKDYRKASQYMEQAARISRNPFHANLAARFFYESDETGIAISFLKFMIDQTWNQQVKKTLETRLEALEAVDFLQKGVTKFEEQYHGYPKSIEEMIAKGILMKIPEDPYGGKFYIDDRHRIRSTSRFAFKSTNEQRHTNRTFE